MCLKVVIAAVMKFLDILYEKLNGQVSAIPTFNHKVGFTLLTFTFVVAIPSLPSLHVHRESTDSLMYTPYHSSPC